MNDARASASVTQVESEGLVDARVSPLGSLENLSQREVQQLLNSGQGGVYELFRRCALAVLTSGLESDDVRAIFERYKDFEIRLGRQAWGIKLEVKNAPASAFVDGQMIRGIKEHLFAVLRDIVYIHDAILGSAPLRSERSGQHHQRGLSHPAQRADPRLQGSSGSGRLLGRPFDRRGRIRLHQAGRLRARPARAQRLHRLRARRDERAR